MFAFPPPPPSSIGKKLTSQSASPVFLFVFSLYLFFTFKPCGYCIALVRQPPELQSSVKLTENQMSILFLSTSPASPFLSLTPPTLSNEDPESILAPQRTTWYDLNHGYLFDPVIKAFSDHATSAIASSTAAPTTTTGVPEGYKDWRYRGLGMVLDFGWSRDEQGMEWEMEDWRETRRRHGGDLEGEGRMAEHSLKEEATTGGADKSIWTGLRWHYNSLLGDW
jgi:hypothetical protein